MPKVQEKRQINHSQWSQRAHDTVRRREGRLANVDLGAHAVETEITEEENRLVNVANC